MPVITCTAETRLPADRFLAALLDFSPQRPQHWPNLDPSFYTVHQLGPTWAEVTEGSRFAGGIWERARYDWSTPQLVTVSVLASNAFAPGGSWTYRVQPTQAGSRVEVRIDRRGRTVKGHLLATLLRALGRQVFCGDLRTTLRRLETA